jgi:prepilin-type N-terminal cleavage/methylation domain-containing protein
MIKSLKRYSVAGFSLVELMVVVAIIGILAAVAIPNFNKFQRRARAAEGKTALGGLYNAQKSFLAEWEGYHASMAAIGYTFDGSPRTQVATGTTVGTTGAARYQAEAVAAAMATEAATFHRLDVVCGNAIFMPGCMAPPAANRSLAWVAGAEPAGAGVLTPGAAGVPGTFTASAGTNVGSNADEVWTMTETKVLTQIADGVNAN